MTHQNQNIPFYLQMVSQLRNALDLLDEEGQAFKGLSFFAF